MEGSSFPFTYKGSIADAITEAQTKKRLFVVYISGDDDASTSLEQSTWMDQRVAESISKHCIFLHLVEGSVDALQFSAIYPQNSVPNISVVGFNGVMIWQHGGFISAENLVENVEKAWATLHIQETAAVLLTAALASKKSEPSTSSIIASPEEGSSSSTNVSTFTNNSQNSDVTPLTNFAERDDERISEKFDGNKFSSKDVLASSSTISADTNSRGCDAEHTYENSRVTSEGEENTANENIKRATNCSTASGSRPKSDQDDPVHHCDSESQRNPEMIAKEVEGTQEEKVEGSARSLNVTRPTDVHLNIRLPSGTCLQMRFPLTDTLRSVKNYVDENAVSNIGVYDLAIPYPRKIFMEQDMSKTMSELGFASREALIVVPHQHVALARRVQSSSFDTNAANEADPSDNDSGYFAFLKRILSYVNPFSYLGENSHSSSSEPVPSSSQQQGPTPWSNPSAVEGSYSPYASGERNLQPGNNANTATRRTPSRFGGNIHTLRDVEREDPSSDSNFFWNGNSTQFGGDDKN